MSNEIQDGGPALPTTEANFHNENMRGEGMSLRDYFAAKAMASIINTCDTPCVFGIRGVEAEVAITAYSMADAMLAARKA